MSTLDAFFGPQLVKSRQNGVFVEERCSNPACRKLLAVNVPKYVIRSKGKEAPYCQECARAILPKSKVKNQECLEE